jgi:protein arginine kinase activator
MTGMLVCTQCGFTYAEFQTRGLLGCPQCYVCFGKALWADLLQMHPGLYRYPVPELAEASAPGSRANSGELEELARLKEMLADALRGERYEEAAALQGRIQIWEKGHGSG